MLRSDVLKRNNMTSGVYPAFGRVIGKRLGTQAQIHPNAEIP